MDAELFVPITLFGTIPVIVWLFQMYAARKRIEAYKTLQMAIDKGQPLTPESLAAMARISPPNADLRRGIIFIAIAVAFAALAGIIGVGADSETQEAVRAILGVGVFPLSIGLAFIGLHFFARDKP